jgi:hypothetical protein
MLSHPFIGISKYGELNKKTYDIFIESGATCKVWPIMRKDTNILL